MKKTVLGMMSVAALMASAAFANDPPTDDTQLAAADLSAAAFKKLDENTDGRVSAIEAANDTNVAANFTKADKDKDGYLSKNEFKMIGHSNESSEAAASPQADPSQSTTREPPQ